MSFWRRRHRLDLEGELAELRPVPRDEFLHKLVGRVREDGAPAARTRRGSLRVAFAGALVVGLLAGLGAVGGIGYAASVATHTVRAVKHAVAPAKPTRLAIPRGINAGGDQYRPGFGFGDRNHTHTGPPGLTRRGGANAPPTRAPKTNDGKAFIATGRFDLDEQADVRLSVLDSDGNMLLLTQNGSFVGATPFSGVQTKVLHYVLLIPRTNIQVRLRIPANLVDPGKTYRILVRAIPPTNLGPQVRLELPFVPVAT